MKNKQLDKNINIIENYIKKQEDHSNFQKTLTNNINEISFKIKNKIYLLTIFEKDNITYISLILPLKIKDTNADLFKAANEYNNKSNTIKAIVFNSNQKKLLLTYEFTFPFALTEDQLNSVLDVAFQQINYSPASFVRVIEELK